MNSHMYVVRVCYVTIVNNWCINKPFFNEKHGTMAKYNKKNNEPRYNCYTFEIHCCGDKPREVEIKFLKSMCEETRGEARNGETTSAIDETPSIMKEALFIRLPGSLGALCNRQSLRNKTSNLWNPYKKPKVEPLSGAMLEELKYISFITRKYILFIYILR